MEYIRWSKLDGVHSVEYTRCVAGNRYSLMRLQLFWETSEHFVEAQASHIAHSASHIYVAYSVASHNRPRRLIDPLPISAQTPSFVCFYLRLAIYSCARV